MTRATPLAQMNSGVVVDGPAGTIRPVFGTTAGVSRWELQLGNGAAETGSNVGSDFGITRYTDAGAFIDSPISITRSTGQVFFAKTPSIPGYLPLVGGTLTGPLIGTTATFSGALTVGGSIASNSGAIYSKASGSGNAVFVCQNNTGANVGNFFWVAATGAVGISQLSSGATAYVDSSGIFNASGPITAGTGYNNRPGTAGAPTGQLFNFNWTGTLLQAWINTTNVGTVAFTSDYRAKKDVADLSSMWDQVKALKPISYTYQDFDMPGAALDQGDVEPLPLVVGSDEEHWGFLAHELQETLIPTAATGEKDSETHLQSPNPWTVIAALTRALQEAMERIEALEASR